MASAVDVNRLTTASLLVPYGLAHTSAAVPATCGEAIDVPLSAPYPVGSVSSPPCLSMVEYTVSPGAANVTVGPSFENQAGPSLYALVADGPPIVLAAT